MLVSQKVADAMYNKESILYKSFSLIFSNSLWDNSVPNGFPICPYFWLSLFSMIFILPIDLAIRYFIKMPLICLGTLLGNSDPKYVRNASIGVVVLIVVYEYVVFTLAAFRGGAGLIIPLYITHIGVIMSFIAHRYDFKSHVNKNLHWVYVATLLLLTVCLSVIFTPYAIPLIISILCDGVISFFIWVLCIIGSIGSMILDIFKFGYNFIISNIKPIVLTLLCFSGVSSISFLLMRFQPKINKNVKVDYQLKWKSIILSYYTKRLYNEFNYHNTFEILKLYPDDTPKAAKKMKQLQIACLVASKYISSVPDNELDILHDVDPNLYSDNIFDVSSTLISNLNSDLPENIYDLLRQYYTAFSGLDLYLNRLEYNDNADTIYSEESMVLKTANKEFESSVLFARYNQLLLNHSKRKDTTKKLESLCSKIIDNHFKPILEKLSIVKEWAKTGWLIVKKKKSDACPYFIFKDKE